MVDVFERIFSKELMAKEAKGEARGEARGRLEGIVSTARKLLSMGVLSLKQIAQATGLSVSELEAMRDEIHQGS